MEKWKGGNKKEKKDQWRSEGKGIFFSQNVGLMLWYWEIAKSKGGVEAKTGRFQLVLLSSPPSLPPSLLPSFPPSLVSSPSLCRITVSDGTGLTGRRRSEETVVLSSALEMTCDTCAHTHTHTQTFLGGCRWRHHRVVALTQNVAREIRSEQTTHTYSTYASTYIHTHTHTHTSNEIHNLASDILTRKWAKCFMFLTWLR